MTRFAYAMRLVGVARRIGSDGNVLRITTVASGEVFRCPAGLAGSDGSPQPVLSGEMTCEADLVLTGQAMFQQTGTIAFGTGGHRLRFSTVGSGHLGPAPDADGRHGAVIWRVDGGEGRFAGASGIVACTFLLSDAGEITDHHLGVIFVR